MNVLPIILATLLGVVSTSPVNSPGFKERIFNVAINKNDKFAELMELLETSDISTRNSILDDLIWAVVDMARDVIINGSGDIPVLDPFVLDRLHVDGDIVNLPNSHVTLNNVNVLNLGAFEIDQLSVSTVNIILQRYRIDLDGRIPALDIQAGNYDMSVDIFGGNVFGNGEARFKVVNPRLHGNVVVGLRLAINGIFITLRECELHFKLEDFQAQITGLFNNEVASEFVSEFLTSLLPNLVEFFEEDITNILSDTVLQVGNEILADLNLIDLLP